MPAPLPSIWATPYLLDHSTNLQLPLSATASDIYQSILLDSPAVCLLLPGGPGIHTNWLGTLNQPFRQPLPAPVLVSVDVRFFVVQAPGGYARLRLTAAGHHETKEFRDSSPSEIGQNEFMQLALVRLPAGATSFDLRIDAVIDRPDQTQQTQITIDSLDLKAELAD